MNASLKTTPENSQQVTGTVISLASALEPTQPTSENPVANGCLQSLPGLPILQENEATFSFTHAPMEADVRITSSSETCPLQTLLVLDFDWSMIEENSDTFVVRELGGWDSFQRYAAAAAAAAFTASTTLLACHCGTLCDSRCRAIQRLPT